MKRYAFTISEVLVTLAVIGIVAMLTIPLVNHIIPNQDIVLTKKSLDTVQRNIQILTNNADIYVDGTFDSFPSDVSAGDYTNYFCNSFVDQLNIKGTVNCTSSGTSGSLSDVDDPDDIDDACSGNIGDVAFKTTDGIRWYKMRGTFTEGEYNVICVKVSDEANPFGIAIREDGRTVAGSILSTCLDADPKTDRDADCPLYD